MISLGFSQLCNLFSNPKAMAQRPAFCIEFAFDQNVMVLARAKAKEVVPFSLFPSIKGDLVPWGGLCSCGFHPIPVSRLLGEA